MWDDIGQSVHAIERRVEKQQSHALETCGASPLSKACFLGSEWQRPVRGDEAEPLLTAAYWLAVGIDRVLGRDLVALPSGLVPQTEWPRMFANWKLAGFAVAVLSWAVLW